MKRFSTLLLTLMLWSQLGAVSPVELTHDFFNIPDLDCSAKRALKLSEKKPWTFLIYMAADNDLAPFARKNLMQLLELGSTDFINILVHLDILLPGKKKTTLRYFVQKGKLVVTNEQDPTAQKMDSGNPETLISACKWAIENFPSDHFALDFWNHGTGILNPLRHRTINPSELFVFNAAKNILELDRSIPFIELISIETKGLQRGICFDDSTKNYLNNNDVVHALSTVQKNYLNGKKMDVVCFDACLMAMLEIATILEPFADYMVGAQEVELGSGYEYSKVIAPFAKQSLSPKQFATHMVKEFGSTYEKITNDYTQSAINLHKITELEKSVNAVAELLLDALKNQQGASIKNALKASRHKQLCTHFDETSYLDLAHLFSNILNNLANFTCTNAAYEQELKNKLREALKKTLSLISNTVIANTTGKNLKNARGISIYFPELRLHPSYKDSAFASRNKWYHFIVRYLSM